MSQARRALGEGCNRWHIPCVAQGLEGAREARANLTGVGTSAVLFPH